jgi:hypothetical protein
MGQWWFVIANKFIIATVEFTKWWHSTRFVITLPHQLIFWRLATLWKVLIHKTCSCISNQLIDSTSSAGESGLLLNRKRKLIIAKLKSSRLSYVYVVVCLPFDSMLSKISRYVWFCGVLYFDLIGICIYYMHNIVKIMKVDWQDTINNNICMYGWLTGQVLCYYLVTVCFIWI